jgi:hypothetical protein
MHVFIYSATNLSFYIFFLNINAIYIYIYIYIYIIDAFETLRFRGFFENDAPDASLPKNAPASLRALATLVSWLSRKQKSVALSSAEAEYMAASQSSCEAIWLHKLSIGLFGQELGPMMIYCDNHSCLKLMENPIFHDRSKYIEI